VSSVNPIVDTY